MGTILGVRKQGAIILGTDCVNVRDPALTEHTSAGLSCLFKFGDSLVALHSTLAYQTALSAAIPALFPNEIPSLISTSEIHTTFARIHEALRNRGFMFVSFQQGQDFEWTPMTALIANRSGLYRIDSARGVIECPKYVALGTGEAFAMGALASGYETLPPETLASNALDALSTLDPLSGGLKHTLTLRVPTLQVAKKETPPERETAKTLKMRRRKDAKRQEPS